MNISGREIDILQLQQEIEDAGIEIRALGTTDDDLHTYDDEGEAIDIPAEAYEIVDAHTPYEAPETEKEILLSIYGDLDPGTDDYAQVQHLVIMQLLRE